MIDFTYTSHRTGRTVTFAPLGGPQPKLLQELSQFTNCIVTIVWSDGVNRTPALLYTNNPEFVFTKGRSSSRQSRFEWLMRCCNYYEIDQSRITDMSKYTSNNSKYVKESVTTVKDVLKVYEKELQKAAVIFRDAGNCYVENGIDLIEEANHKVVVLPPAIHQYLSVNDNKLHGVAKQYWRAGVTDFKDDVDASLYLLWRLDEVKEASIKQWFNENLCLDGGRVTEERVRIILNMPDLQRREHFNRCLLAYRQDVLNESVGSIKDVYSTADTLDGVYWN